MEQKKTELKSSKQPEKRHSRQVSIASLCISEKEEKVKKPNFSNPSELVTLNVRNQAEAEPFIVHKEFACFYSPVLNAAFNGEYVESQTQSYLLEDVAASTCRFLVQWLYTQCFDVCHAGLEPSVTNIDSNSIKAMISSDTTHEVEEKRKASAGLAKQVIQKKDAQQDASEEEPGDDVYHQELEFIKLWILADALLIRPLQNHIVEVLEAIWDDPRSGDPVWTDFIPYVYDNTSEESPLRHLFIDKIAYDWGSSDILEHHAEALPRELLLDLFSIFSAAISADTQTNARGQICKKMDVKGKQMYTCKRVWRNYFVFEDE